MNDYIDTLDDKTILIDANDAESKDKESNTEQLNVNIEETLSNFEESIRKEKLTPFIDFEEVFDGGRVLLNWQRYKRMVAKIISIHETYVVLECQLDDEKEVFTEKKVDVGLLEDVSLLEGNYLLFNYYKKKKEWKIEILDDQRLFVNSSFPEVDFDRFENISFFKDE